MKTTEFNEEEIKEIYKTASVKIKEKLKKCYGEDFFIIKKITDIVKTFEDAVLLCSKSNIDISDIVFEKSDSPSVKAFKQLQIIIKALNEGWQPNWNNSNECKYYPCFNMGSSGFGFSITHYGGWRTDTSVGSRLCLKNRQLAEYAGKQFTEIYKDFLT